MGKRWEMMMFVILAMLVFSGCAKTVDEKRMQADLPEMYTLNEGEKIEKIVIEKRQTDKGNKTDTIWCLVTTADEYISYQREMVLSYGLYKKGWILDDVSVNASNEWVKTPLQGIKEDNIKSSLFGRSITVEGETWLLNDNVKDISVINHDTDLDAKKDVVTISLTVEDEVEEITGELTVNYMFADGWKLDSLDSDDKFSVSVKPEVELKVTEADLLAKISGQSFVLREPKTGGIKFVWQAEEDMHTVSIKDDEISNLVIKEQEVANKGTEQIYHCECTLRKDYVTFALEAAIPYRYQSGEWVSSAADISAKCDTLDIAGEWVGTYKNIYTGDAVLNILDVDGDGNITGTYSYTPAKEDKYSYPGSYNVLGTINMSTLDMKLSAGDWIEKPAEVQSWSKADISATLCVDEAVIKGSTGGIIFEVKR